MSGGIVSGMAELLGRRNLTKGVKVAINEQECEVDLNIVVTYGVKIPEVTAKIQGDVKSLSLIHILKFIKENMDVQVKFFKGSAFSVEPPNFVELEVTQTDPGFKGDTATAGTKPATLETGAVVQVPMSIDQGEIIRVDTRTGEYMSRA